jgi:NAD(P)-dependent dehydrogenase (short-subunit alcohol dehydrogenase family)
MADRAKVVLVTGASAGIGLACADLLHAAGWIVIGASRRGTAGCAPERPADGTPAAAAGGWTGRWPTRWRRSASG